jgi:hypothetical protein
MALGPKDLRSPLQHDLDVISYYEKLVDNLESFQTFNGEPVTINFPQFMMEEFLGNRGEIRKREFARRYVDAGWGSVQFTKDSVIFTPQASPTGPYPSD